MPTESARVLALQWSDVDLDADNPSVRVKGTLQRLGGALVVTDPKSVKARRTIGLSGRAVTALRAHRARQATRRLAAGEQWEPCDLVFTTSLGTPVDPRNFLRQWHRLLAEVGVPGRSLHQARHAAASLMLSEGVPLKVVQETLGHSTIRLTADLYGHLMPHDETRVVEAIDRALGA